MSAPAAAIATTATSTPPPRRAARGSPDTPRAGRRQSARASRSECSARTGEAPAETDRSWLRQRALEPAPQRDQRAPALLERVDRARAERVVALGAAASLRRRIGQA